MKNGKRWAIIDIIVSIVSGLLGIFGIFTGIKAATYNEQKQYEDLEARYGLTPQVEVVTEDGETV